MESELESLRARVAHLESLVERLAGRRALASRPEEPSSAAEKFDRRRLLRHGLGLGAVAVSGVTILDASTSSAAADDGSAVTVGQSVAPTSSSSAPTRIYNPAGDYLSSVGLFRVDNTRGATLPLPEELWPAIVGTAGDQGNLPGTPVGVLGVSDYGAGVWAVSQGDALVATSQSRNAVLATSVTGIGVQGTSTKDGGVSGTSHDGAGVMAGSVNGPGLVAGSNNEAAVFARGGYTLMTSTVGKGAGIGVLGLSDANDGVTGESTSGNGVHAISGSGVGLLAHSGAGHGVEVTSDSSTAIVAATTTDGEAVLFTNLGTGPGLSVQSTQGMGVTASGGVSGAHFEGGSAGVEAISSSGSGLTGSSTSGAGVSARSSSGPAVEAVSGTSIATVQTKNTGNGTALRTDAFGIGATLAGQSAPVRLMPHKRSGHPRTGSHGAGELVVDDQGTLWVCIADGQPGTWRRLAYA